jgi:ketosteroid isomerase-like protein
MSMQLRRIVLSFVLGGIALGTVTAVAQTQSAEEQTVWKLEHAYWEYVKSLDMKQYKSLWHPDFVGWPSSSAEPARKDHITDWITTFTDKGLRLQSYTLQPAASQATGNVVIAHYWLTELWVDKQGRGEPNTVRITHTWVHTPEGWQILGGMSASATKPPGHS